jgi:hypothetical protein
MSTESLQDAGPLLSRLLDAQRKEEALVAYPAIEAIADAAISVAEGIDGCLVWPITAAAERVAGVVAVRSRGAVDIGTWNTPVAGRAIVLLGVAAATPLGLEMAAEQLRRRGAAEVHACAFELTDAEQAHGFDSFQSLAAPARQESLSLVGDAA